MLNPVSNNEYKTTSDAVVSKSYFGARLPAIQGASLETFNT